ncbi:MAG: 50S ribosomal protein L11 methyltransferase [Clostridiales bacterium]|nr:50S ribosomal protein L11 methyltransferase [Clostridiales bacterium]
MMEQIWLECSIDTAPGCLDALAAYLTACGVEGLVLEDESDFAAFEDENRPFWDEVDEALKAERRGVTRATFYVTADEEGRCRLDEITAGLEGFRSRTLQDAGTLAVTTRTLQEEDWANNWKRYYSPFPVGQRLYVVPEWMRGEPVPEGRTPLYLNPGLIFGTGSHGTTRLCLEGVERYVRPGDRVLDLGTGSGILAIAALRLGAAFAVGCDIDPKATAVAAENAAFNGIGPELRVCTGNVIGDRDLQARLAGRYQLVLANIVADVILPLCPLVGDYLAEGGLFLTSGILEGRADEVAAALTANGFAVLERRERDGWVSFTAARKGETP